VKSVTISIIDANTGSIFINIGFSFGFILDIITMLIISKSTIDDKTTKILRQKETEIYNNSLCLCG
jgi:hypothetical protein